ncbi:MAG TPA: anti-sigma factor [Chloroflexota bacterium]|nr:anti-sigma factor [Chloroflexota bacterium]
MSEHHCVDLLGGYALGSLEEADHERVVSHVRICAWCRAEAEQIADCLHGALGYHVPPAVPGSHVRVRLLARLAEEAAALGAMAVPSDAVIAAVVAPTAVAHGPESTPSEEHGGIPRGEQRQPGSPHAERLDTMDPPPGQGSLAPVALEAHRTRRPRIVQTRWLAGFSTLAAALVLGLGVALVSTHQQLDDQRAHLLSDAFTGAHAAMALAGPALKHGMSGEVIMRPGENTGLVIVSGVPKSAGKMAYTCWLHQRGRWLAGGSLRPDASGIAMVVLDKSMNVHKADEVAITMEYANRTPVTPSTPMLLSVTL